MHRRTVFVFFILVTNLLFNMGISGTSAAAVPDSFNQDTHDFFISFERAGSPFTAASSGMIEQLQDSADITSSMEGILHAAGNSSGIEFFSQTDSREMNAPFSVAGAPGEISVSGTTIASATSSSGTGSPVAPEIKESGSYNLQVLSWIVGVVSVILILATLVVMRYGSRAFMAGPGPVKRMPYTGRAALNRKLSASVTQGTSIRPAVFEAALDIAEDLAREGREGKPVGTALVLGDAAQVMQRSRQLILNPFEGHPPSEKMVTDPLFKENIKEFSRIDGMFVISDDGVAEAAGRLITIDTGDVSLPKGLGTRHTSVAALTRETRSVGIVVSSSGGTIRIIKNGKLLQTIHPV
jgi:DNA integrity scanning protein DisA with diadenylate cyclase activity